ncbi:histidine acid phosphatase, partial [Teladorsagia circumcincta]
MDMCRVAVLTYQVFRHGDRAPMAGSTSRESESYYFRGKEQLTDKGLQQAYQLGLSLRRRYVDNGFLDARFLPSQVVFRSSPVERCLMTASAAASAMFNLTEDGRPIAVPIFTVPKKDDYVCVPRLECPFVVKEMAETLGLSSPSPTMYDLLIELFKQESKRLNYTRVVGNRLHLFEPLFLEHDAGLAVPQWFDDEARKEADHLLDLTIEFLSGTATFHNPSWIITRSGKLLSTIARNHKKAVEQSLGGVKFFAFSTHDATISALLDSLGILKEALAPQGRPDFTAAIAFEVWRNDSGHYVK